MHTQTHKTLHLPFTCMADKYALIERFPESSFSNAELSLITRTLEGKHKVNPCEYLHEYKNEYQDMSTEEIVEHLAFEYTEALSFFLDVKKYYFNSRKIDSIRLTDVLRREFEYDPAILREYKDDKKSMFLMLFHETYNNKDNKLDTRFLKLQIGARKFKERRDRRTTIDTVVDVENLPEKINDFIAFADTESELHVSAETYQYNDECIVLLSQEKKRTLDMQYTQRSSVKSGRLYDEITYVENYPVQQCAIKFVVTDADTTEVHVDKSVSSWEEILSKLFMDCIDTDITEQLQNNHSKMTENIISEVKNTTDKTEKPENTGDNIISSISSNISQNVDAIDEDDIDVPKERVESKADRIQLRGISVDSEDTTFELRSEEGIQKLFSEFDGLSESLAETIKSAEKEDITIVLSVPDGEDGKEVMLSEEEWSIENNTVESKESQKILEYILD